MPGIDTRTFTIYLLKVFRLPKLTHCVTYYSCQLYCYALGFIVFKWRRYSVRDKAVGVVTKCHQQGHLKNIQTEIYHLEWQCEGQLKNHMLLFPYIFPVSCLTAVILNFLSLYSFYTSHRDFALIEELTFYYLCWNLKKELMDDLYDSSIYNFYGYRLVVRIWKTTSFSSLVTLSEPIYPGICGSIRLERLKQVWKQHDGFWFNL